MTYCGFVQGSPSIAGQASRVNGMNVENAQTNVYTYQANAAYGQVKKWMNGWMDDGWLDGFKDHWARS